MMMERTTVIFLGLNEARNFILFGFAEDLLGARRVRQNFISEQNIVAQPLYTLRKPFNGTSLICQ